jgi:ParB family transcriptional regulator, chromosome partitioning protein
MSTGPNAHGDLKVHLVPIDHIQVINPRSRGKKKFSQIIANISKLGLKKPITVTRRDGRNGHTNYDLVCGQGRLEAYRALGQEVVPAIVVDVERDELLLMSLAENLARKRYTAVELAKEISALKDRGYDYPEIARKTDLDVNYVRGIIRLLNKGEERLLRAVEQGQIPISIAITIASADDEAVQRALTEAYESKRLRGKALLKARQLIEYRRTHGKGRGRVRGRDENSVTSEKLLKTFHLELNKQRVLVKKAKVCETRLLFIVSAMKSLRADENFLTLLRAEGLDTLPKYLAEQLTEGGV